ncbi:HAD family hydrolase [Agarivorans sp. Toyoura001]|uniref:HAD family hydrolase n=1 Tax=unclassified Agarivorans TaxID=2636026 RepID=UPI0010D46EA7|nr:HAD family hydrolase [Agarivorans sp. Toyoura001]GDY24658.1 haloacid dehalogenase [Agarivorans sp. Toyoura001]
MDLHIFDLDDTLIAGDSGVLWHQYLVEQGIVTQAGFLAQDAAMMEQYAQGELALEEYIRFSLSPIQSLSCSQIDQLVEDFIQQHIRQIIYPEGQKLIDALLYQQHQVLIISATVSFIVKQVAKQLSVKDFLGVDLKLKNGSYSEHIDGVASFREGKVIRLLEWQENKPQAYQRSYFYSDSINDRALLEHVDKAYVVNPCPKLKRLAMEKSWSMLSWQL